ncbi:hypothetical protein ACFO4M_31920, partial [Pseudonocardia nematodicida]|uniref:hypothetical protein n=1 Tax=Pseudonocardia nematodicida TaxID=1206997 RepID=UPI00361DC6E4
EYLKLSFLRSLFQNSSKDLPDFVGGKKEDLFYGTGFTGDSSLESNNSDSLYKNHRETGALCNGDVANEHIKRSDIYKEESRKDKIRSKIH